MAILGDKISQVETGWKRYDDNDKNIEYSSKFQLNSWSTSYGGNTHYLPLKDDTQFIRFNFTGKKLRLYGAGYSGLPGENDIYIDGQLYHQHYRYTNNMIILTFNIDNLTDKEHYVEIKSGNCARVYLDAIDIDINGELKPYNENPYKFLIKQNNQYYSIKPEFYKNGQFQPLTLEGGEQPNENDYESFGFYNVNDLLISQNTKAIQGINKGELGEGKYFEVELDNDIKKINDIR